MRLALVVLSLLLVTPAAARSVQTRVWISDEHPLVVRGAGFASADEVTVTVHKGRAVFRKTVAASRTGAFRAAWLRAMPAVCSSTKVLAVGTSGRRATYVEIVGDCSQPPTR